MSRLRAASGQASVELIAVLPLVALVVAALWQGVVVGRAAWVSAGAARAAARAQAIGADPLTAARAAVPPALRRDVRVGAQGGGVRVGIAVPLVFTRARLTTIHARATLPAQR